VGLAAESAPDTRLKHAKGGVAMAIATFTMATTSGIQALLYLGAFGIDGRTDGLFAALAPYVVFGIFSQSIRVTAVPLLVGERPRISTAIFGRALCLIALPVALATIVFAGPLSTVLAPGLSDESQAITAAALPLFGGAMILQLFAAGAATVLAIRDRFNAIATAYIVGSLAGLGTYLAVAEAAGELSLAWSMLGMAVATVTTMMLSLRSGDGPPEVSPTPERPPVLHASALILGRTLVYLVLNSLYLITLAFASGYAAGDTTVLSYAYLFASYLVAGTGFALGLSRIADMRRASPQARLRAVRDTVPPGFRYSMLILAGAFGLLIVAGAPLIGSLLPHAFSASDVGALRSFAALLSAWAVAALLVNLLLPVLFALGRGRFVNLLAPGLATLHVAATALGGALYGVYGVAGAAWIAPAAFAAVLLAAAARSQAPALARELGRDTLRFAIPAAAAFGLGAAAGALTGGEQLIAALVAAVVGTLLYIVFVRVAAPRQAAVLAGRLRPLEPNPTGRYSAALDGSANAL
jgi:peptidoglycan biosynthesis protein MviN/MurJ (putative lipid II flippase)